MLNNIVGGLGFIVLNDFQSIQTATVGVGGVASVSFTSIPSNFHHLQIRHSALTSVADRYFKIQFNSDTGTNYSWHYVRGNGTATSASAGATQNFAICGLTPNSTIYPGVGVTDIVDYNDTNKYKTIRSLVGGGLNTTAGYAGLYSGNWQSTSAISSITITPLTGNFSQNSSFALYGIK